MIDRHVTGTIAVLALCAAACTSGHPGPAANASSGTAAASSTSAAASAAATPVALPTPGPATSGGAITAGLVPLPVLASTAAGQDFTLTPATKIVTTPDAGAAAVADDLAAALRPATGYPLPVSNSVAGDVNSATPANAIVLRLDTDRSSLGDEGYDLTVTARAIVLAADKPAGLFHGVETLRQLLPASIEATTTQQGPWRVTGGRIVDYPRFAYRGAMLDVARHFFPVATVERYIDELALYKVNTLHLHLSDDQGWRIAIDGWPNLTAHGGSTSVGGGPGGFYTQAQYTQIVDYAAAHFITIVPEIDTPSHTNAALSSYPELNCNGVAPPLYTGENVGFSTLCVGKAITYRFLDDVVGQLAALTPGPYIHLGGDEAHSTSTSDYVAFVQKAAQIVQAHGKQLMGWAEISNANLGSSAVAEYWNFSDKGVSEGAATAQGMKIVAAPADHAYLDQKYNDGTPLGLNWAGDTSVEDAYAWDPTDGGRATDSQLLGVEAPLWSETLHSISDIEYMAWPRMAGIAEIGWTPQGERTWSTYAPRLAQQGPRWTQLGVNFFRSPDVAWAP